MQIQKIKFYDTLRYLNTDNVLLTIKLTFKSIIKKYNTSDLRCHKDILYLQADL